MTTPYFPVPVVLPISIQLPQDVIDDVVVGTVNPPLQDLANFSRLSQDIISAWGMWHLDAATTVDGDPLPIHSSALAGGAGFVSSGGEITVPSAGAYEITFLGLLKSLATANPYLFQDGSGNPSLKLNVGGTVGRAVGIRWSSFTSDFIPTSAHALVSITDPSVQKISLVNGTGFDVFTFSGIAGVLASSISVKRIA